MTSPLEAMRTKKTGDHLSDFAIDALVAEDAPEENAEKHRAHLAACDDCRARFDVATKDAAQFSREAPALMIPRKNKANRTTAIYAAASAVAIAAGVLLFMKAKPPPDDELTTRLKGSSHIGFFVKHGDAVTTGTGGAHVKPGDALRFTYHATHEKYLGILSVDGDKHASIYFPDGPTAAPIEPGTDHALPSSTVLDDTLGHETIYAFFCDSPVELEPIRVAFAASPNQVPSVSGCNVDAFAIDKDPASTP